MAFTLSISGYVTSYAYAKFDIYYKTSADAEWTRTGTNNDGFKAIPAWGQDSEMWVQLIKDWTGNGFCLQQRSAGGGWVSPELKMGDSFMDSTNEYERVEWDASHVIFRIFAKDYGANKTISVSIPQSNCSRVIMDETRAFIDGCPWVPGYNETTLLKLRSIAPASFVKSEKPTVTFPDTSSNHSVAVAWNEQAKGWDLTINPSVSYTTNINYVAEVIMATEKYGAFGDLGKSLSVTPVSTDTVIAVLARGKTNLNAATFADLSAYLNDKPINPNDACDMCAYALYATSGVNNVVWCGGTDLAACIKTFQDYMTRTPQVSCIVIDGGFTTTKEDAATILAGIKKIDGHWDATAILNCNAAQDHTGKPCSSEDAVVTMGFIKTGANVLPLSAIRAGLCARSDAEYGAPARSGGNLPIPNAEAWGSYDSNNFTAMPISETLATSLSAEGVCAVVNYSGTYRTWGDHTSLFSAGTITDERARFDNSIRMLRSITNRFQLKYRASIDSPFTLQMRNDIINEQLDYLNGLVAKGALIGKPTCEFRAIDNPKDNIQKGEFKWNITCTTTNPLKYAYVSVSYTSAGLDSLLEEG